MKRKLEVIEALEAKLPEDILDELNGICLGWMFANSDKTYHVIIDVDWLLEHERQNPECEDVQSAVAVLDGNLKEDWRKTKILYLKGKKTAR